MIGQHRIFADHYQFYVFDSEADPYQVGDEWSDEVIKKGFIQGKYSVHIVTVGDCNDHAVVLYLGGPRNDLPEGCHDAIAEIRIDSGKVKLSSPAYGRDTEPEFNINPGIYKLTIRTLNPGVEDPDAVEGISDDEFFGLKHLERYELYFEPKV